MSLVAAIALVPLALGVVLIDQRAQAQRDQDRALETEVGSAAARLRDSFAETRATVLITAHNPVFRDFYRLGGDRGSVYRLGGDEFCVIAGADEGSIPELKETTSKALAEHGDGFTVTTACGLVLAPLEGTDQRELLRLADQRLYAAKRNGRFGVGRQTTDVLVKALQERHPDLHSHLKDVAELAGEVALRLGMGSDEVDWVRQAGALHDLGKMAIPDAIPSKPGKLDPAEWKFIHQHTLIGERILVAAPALTEVARLVRSSHERWDGLGIRTSSRGA